MTPRSEPKPDCTYCRGVGIISVSKDPDLDADCVCTDPVEQSAAEKVDGFAKSVGIHLMSWQRDLAVRLLDGEHATLAVLAVGRGGGLRTVRRVVEGARYV